MKTKIILGPPGTGKTHNLLSLVEQELARGTPPDRIAFVAFTKKAAHEARDRAMKKFNLEEQHLPNFRTLHSFAFHQLGLTKSEVMSRDNYKEFAQAFGMEASMTFNEDGTAEVSISVFGNTETETGTWSESSDGSLILDGGDDEEGVCPSMAIQFQ